MSNEPKSWRGRVYTHGEKAQAVALAERVGTSAAARALGAPDSTVCNWRTRGIGAPKVSVPTPVAAVEVPALTPAVVAPAGPIVPTAAPAACPTARPRIAKVYTPSQVAQALERVAAIGVRPAAAELGISRNALRDWERMLRHNGWCDDYWDSQRLAWRTRAATFTESRPSRAA